MELSWQKTTTLSESVDWGKTFRNVTLWLNDITHRKEYRTPFLTSIAVLNLMSIPSPLNCPHRRIRGKTKYFLARVKGANHLPLYTFIVKGANYRRFNLNSISTKKAEQNF
ncbi:hypothetical protein P5673_002069 [Acropora cervicornis]|uniref:Uncharacterized protein n=1 Tax=Acropora cervicornis TaxID=6130 RepID=A0AAD9R4R1_ACRCE|nr:hypothetical protein P5673_002069 [Acropora cervicornis]